MNSTRPRSQRQLTFRPQSVGRPRTAKLEPGLELAVKRRAALLRFPSPLRVTANRPVPNSPGLGRPPAANPTAINRQEFAKIYLVYPTEWWFSAEHKILVVDDRDKVQYAATDIYDCLDWLKGRGETRFLAPRDGALHVLSMNPEEFERDQGGDPSGWELPGSDGVARAFLQKWGHRRLERVTRYWHPAHAFVSFDCPPGEDPFEVGHLVQ